LGRGWPLPLTPLDRRDSLPLLLVPDGFHPAYSLAEFPPYARFLRDLGALGEVILFERRGLGAPAPANAPIELADWADDACAALKARGAERAIVIGLAEGAMTAIAIAACHPGRTAALVLVNATPGPVLPALARCGLGPRYIDMLRYRPQRWPDETPGLEVVAPSLGRSKPFVGWMREAFLAVGGPDRLHPAFDLVFRADVRALVGRVRAPTLVVHRRQDAWFSPVHGTVLARAIPAARYLELPGRDHAPYLGDSRAIIEAIGWFLETAPIEGDEQASCEAARRLTPRQAELLTLVAAGLTDKEIAGRLQLSVRTVQKQLQLAYRRLGVTNRTAAVRAFARLRRPGGSLW